MQKWSILSTTIIYFELFHAITTRFSYLFCYLFLFSIRFAWTKCVHVVCDFAWHISTNLRDNYFSNIGFEHKLIECHSNQSVMGNSMMNILWIFDLFCHFIMIGIWCWIAERLCQSSGWDAINIAHREYYVVYSGRR